MDTSKSSPVDRPYLGQTSLLPPSSVGSGGSSSIKSEPGYEYSCLQSQSYPYQQLFGFSGSGSGNSSEVAYHHQHHVTAAAKLMASS